MTDRWDEAESLLKEALRSLDAPARHLRLTLASVLLHQGKPDEVKSVLAAPASTETSWKGSIPERLDRFKTLVFSKEYRLAFKEAERILDRASSSDVVAVLALPWGNLHSDNDAGVVRSALESDIDVLSRLAARARTPWPFFYRAVLLSACGEHGSEGAFEDVVRFSRRRYGWMWLEVGRARMARSNFAGAVEAFGIALASVKPEDWKIRAYRGQAAMLLGKRGMAFKDFDAACRVAPASERGEAIAWAGEMHLWRGSYALAKRLLDEAVALGALYAYGWRAGARLGLGDVTGALADADQALRLYPNDQESRVWRGEALRILGRHAEALDVLGRAPVGVWARVNRALAFAALGDAQRARADYDLLPNALVSAARKSLKSRRGRIKEILERCLALARGMRREESYAQAIWKTH